MSNWKQPAPTKGYSIYLGDAWYGEGDTERAAWADARRQVQAGHSAYGNAMWAKLRRGGRVVESKQAHEDRCVANYVAEGLGEW